MTLQQFLSATSDVPESVLRVAMVEALALEPARTTDACRRFYLRVIDNLALGDEETAGEHRVTEQTAVSA